MFTCINCTKQTGQEEEAHPTGQEEEAHTGTPRTRDVRNLTAQFRDMASKVSGSYKHLIRPCVGSSSTSEEVQYPYMAGIGSSPTPDDWEFESAPSNTPGGRFDQAIMEGIGGEQTPRSVHQSSPVSEIVEEEYQGSVEEEYQGDPNEWIAQVEPGVNISLVPLTEGGNELKRIRFSRSLFSRWEAQRWWVENYDKVNELYNVRRISRQDLNLNPPPPRIDTIEEEPAAESSPPPLASTRRSPLSSSFKEWAQQGFLDELAETEEGNPSAESGAQQFQAGSSSSMQAPNTTTGSGDNEAVTAVSNESEVETEWVEQDEPGVLVTVRQLENGNKEIRRVRFSRQVFGEEDAKNWWEANRARIHAQYL